MKGLGGPICRPKHITSLFLSLNIVIYSYQIQHPCYTRIGAYIDGVLLFCRLNLAFQHVHLSVLLLSNGRELMD